MQRPPQHVPDNGGTAIKPEPVNDAPVLLQEHTPAGSRATGNDHPAAAQSASSSPDTASQRAGTPSAQQMPLSSELPASGNDTPAERSTPSATPAATQAVGEHNATKRSAPVTAAAPAPATDTPAAKKDNSSSSEEKTPQRRRRRQTSGQRAPNDPRLKSRQSSGSPAVSSSNGSTGAKPEPRQSRKEEEKDGKHSGTASETPAGPEHVAMPVHVAEAGTPPQAERKGN